MTHRLWVWCAYAHNMTLKPKVLHGRSFDDVVIVSKLWWLIHTLRDNRNILEYVAFSSESSSYLRSILASASKLTNFTLDHFTFRSFVLMRYLKSQKTGPKHPIFFLYNISLLVALSSLSTSCAWHNGGWPTKQNTCQQWLLLVLNVFLTKCLLPKPMGYVTIVLYA